MCIRPSPNQTITIGGFSLLYPPPTHVAPRLPQVLVVVSHDRWFCDRVLSPPACDEDDDNFDVRRSSLLVFEGDGAVSQFQGACSLPRF